MPKATECLLGIDLAVALKKLIEQMPVKVAEGNLGLRCKECGKPVKPHESKGKSAHFEHLKRNSECSLSDPSRI